MNKKSGQLTLKKNNLNSHATLQFGNWLTIKALMLMCIAINCYGQELAKSPVYIEDNARIRERLQQALISQYSQKTAIACKYYLALARKAAGKVKPLYYPDFQYILELKRILQAKNPHREFSSKPWLHLGDDTLQHLASVYRRQGLSGLWTQLSAKTTQGLYSGVAEYLRRRLSELQSQKLPAIHTLKREKIKSLIREQLNTADTAKIKALLAENPLYVREEWMQLGDIYFVHGDLPRAIGSWRRFLSLFPAAQETACVHAKIAMSSWLLGDYQVYRAIVKKYQFDNDTQICIRGKQIPMLLFLKRIMRNRRSRLYAGNWVNAHGHSGDYHARLDLSKSRLREKISTDFAPKHFSPRVIPKPLLWGDALYYNFPDKVVCIDLKTGKSKWRKPLTLQSNKAHKITTNINVTTGTIAHGKFYFFSVGKHQPSTIYCLDARTGNQIWRWPDERKTNVLFNASPIVIGNKLFAAAIVDRGQINAELFCFELQAISPTVERPKLLWRRFICSFIKDSYSTKTPIVRGSGLAAGYGLLYYCTNIGIMACVDESGEIRWLAKYKEHSAKNLRLRPYYKRLSLYRNAPHKESLWLNMPPIVKNGRVYVTPVDCEQLLVYDAFSGTLQKRLPDSQDNLRWNHIIGIGNKGTIYLGGTHKIAAFQNNGRKELRWQVSLPERSRGLGLLTKRWIYILTYRSLYQINRRNGRTNKIATSRHARQGVSMTTFSRNHTQYLVISGKKFVIYEVSRS